MVSRSAVALGGSSIEDARQLIKARKYSEAEDLSRRLLKEVETRQLGDSLQAADVLDALGEALSLGGKAREPESQRFAERAIEIRDRLQGPDHLALAQSLSLFATMLNNAGDFQRARVACERSLAIREKLLGPDHPSVANILRSLGNAQRGEADYVSAASTYGRSLDILRKSRAPEDPEIGRGLLCLALACQDKGDYVRARSFYEQSLALLEKDESKQSDVATCLNNLGGLFGNMGNYGRAIDCLERALAIREQLYGAANGWVAMTLNNLGINYRALGDPVKAQAMLERALAIWEKIDPNHPNVSLAAVNLSEVLLDVNEIPLGRTMMDRALRVAESAYGPDHPNVATVLIRRGDMQWWVDGDAREARTSYGRARSILEHALGPDHFMVGDCLIRLAQPVQWLGESEEALDLAILGDGIVREHLRTTIRVLPEEQGVQYRAHSSSGVSSAICSAALTGDSSHVRRTWDAVIRSRALVLDEMGRRRRAVRGDRTPETIRLREELTAATRRFANLQAIGPSSGDPEEYRRLLSEARAAKEVAERQLADHSAEFHEDELRDSIGFDRVASALPEGWALVGFVRHLRWNQTPQEAPMPGEPYNAYGAFVLTGRLDPPDVLSLGSAAEIDSLVTLWKDEVSRGLLDMRRSEDTAEATCRAHGDVLREKVWDPVMKLLDGMRGVFVVVDGSLHFVNFAALPGKDGGYLVERDPIIHYLSAEKDLVPAGEPEEGVGLLALGDADFDAPAGVNAASVMRSPARRSSPGDVIREETGLVVFRGEKPDCASFRSRRYRALPASGSEVNAIVRLWTNSGDSAGVLILKGNEANEREFKLRSSGKRVIHIATHAFFLDANCDSAPAPSRSTGPKEMSGFPSHDVLRLSGLVLSGANHRESTGPDDEDGILTAEEITALDLTGLDAAVLSGCDTGLGEVKIGEGVMGLQRAFQIAGARSVVMSLWSVADNSGREWMQRFYRDRWVDHLGTAEAVREASLQVLEERRQRGESTHPFYWGAFVAIGGPE